MRTLGLTGTVGTRAGSALEEVQQVCIVSLPVIDQGLQISYLSFQILDLASAYRRIEFGLESFDACLSCLNSDFQIVQLALNKLATLLTHCVLGRGRTLERQLVGDLIRQGGRPLR
jgi:hypothetical protein